jgi:hypothetical protein
MNANWVFEKPRYIVGLDLGQSSDYTAAVVLRRTLRPEEDGDPGVPVSHYDCLFIKRWQLKTPYDRIVDDVVELVATDPLDNPKLAVDVTGVGRAVLDLLRKAGPQAWIRPVLITAGHQITEEDDTHHVPKKELVSTLMVLLQNRRFKVANLPERELLVKELVNFKTKITVSANETFEAWRERDHDDLVLAVALAAWVGEKDAHQTFVEVHDAARDPKDPERAVHPRDNQSPRRNWMGSAAAR